MIVSSSGIGVCSTSKISSTGVSESVDTGFSSVTGVSSTGVSESVVTGFSSVSTVTFSESSVEGSIVIPSGFTLESTGSPVICSSDVVS